MSNERSRSRGRDLLLSSGRGGAGNIRSPSRDPVDPKGPEDYSNTRGRDPISSRNPDEITSTGRGGAGNIRSPSRDARPDTVSVDSSPSRGGQRGRGYDRDLIAAIDTEHDNGVYSTGRGGLGNINRSPDNSRSRSRDPVHSAGRGGIGNIYAGESVENSILEEEESERRTHSFHFEGVHSTGRGGTANLTPDQVPNIEVPVNPHGANHPHATHQHDFESTGRGGAGNIERSRSREPRDPNNKDHGLTGFLHRVAHPGTQKGGPEGEGLTA